VKTTAAACSLYAAGDNPALAAGVEDLAKLTISEASRRLRAKCPSEDFLIPENHL
jgi:hypothetical protein